MNVNICFRLTTIVHFMENFNSQVQEVMTESSHTKYKLNKCAKQKNGAFCLNHIGLA